MVDYIVMIVRVYIELLALPCILYVQTMSVCGDFFTLLGRYWIEQFEVLPCPTRSYPKHGCWRMPAHMRGPCMCIYIFLNGTPLNNPPPCSILQATTTQLANIEYWPEIRRSHGWRPHFFLQIKCTRYFVFFFFNKIIGPLPLIKNSPT